MTGVPSRRSGMPVRLVLADDHVVVRQALSLLLTSAGFQVVGEASNGREAVVLVRERAPDVAVLDVVTRPARSSTLLLAPASSC